MVCGGRSAENQLWGRLRREAHRRELAAQRALLLERERDLQVQHLLLQLPLLRGEDRPLLLLSRARQLGGVAQVTQAGWRLRTQESGRALELHITCDLGGRSRDARPGVTPRVLFLTCYLLHHLGHF